MLREASQFQHRPIGGEKHARMGAFESVEDGSQFVAESLGHVWAGGCLELQSFSVSVQYNFLLRYFGKRLDSRQELAP